MMLKFISAKLKIAVLFFFIITAISESKAQNCASVDEHKIVFMGSSVCQGYGATGLKGYAYKYSKILTKRAMEGGEAWNTSNISIGGTNTIQTLNRFDTDLKPECGKYVVFGLSLGNEGIHGSSTPLAVYNQFKNNITSLVDSARDAGYIPVVVNCYSRQDYTSTDYRYVKDMDIFIHQMDVPSINMLGALDDGTGKFGVGVTSDDYHPNDIGYDYMVSAIVPSLFDALEQGKPQPFYVASDGVELNKLGQKKVLQFTPEGTTKSFTISFDIKKSLTGMLTLVDSGIEVATITFDQAGKVIYKSNSNQLTSTLNIDQDWHKVTLTHYAPRGETLLYIDSIKQGRILENISPTTFVLGNSSSLDSSIYKNLTFHRAGMTLEEITLLTKNLLQSSLELYAPLNGLNAEDVLVNLAQSTNTLSYISKTGIRFSDISVTPENVSNEIKNSVFLSVKVSDNESIKLVSVDLSAIGGASTFELTPTNLSNTYTGEYILNPTFLEGSKVITFTAMDNEDNIKSVERSINLVGPKQYLDIFTDVSSEVCNSCVWNAKGDLAIQYNKGAIEGVEDYVFDFATVGWYAGFGLNLTGWDDEKAKDYSMYDTLILSYMGPVGSGTGFKINLVSVDTTSSPVTFQKSTSYKTVKIALSEFENIDLTKIKELQFAITGSKEGSGSIQIDNIRLQGSKDVISAVLKSENQKKSCAIFPNPFSDNISIIFNDDFKGTISIKNEYGEQFAANYIRSAKAVLINTNNLGNGIYILSIEDGSNSNTYKIIKN